MNLEKSNVNEEVDKKPRKEHPHLKSIGRCIVWTLVFVLFNVFGSILGFIRELMDPTFFSQAKSVLDNPVELEKCVDYGLQHSVPIASVMMFLFTGAIMIIRREKEWEQNALGIKTKLNAKEITKYIIMAVTLNIILSFGINLLPDSWVASHAESTSYLASCNFWALLFTSGVLSPICEEYFFRGLCVLEAPSFCTALITSSLLFSLSHWNWIQIFYAFVFGVWFSLEDKKKNSILPSIIIHIAINSSTIILSRIL